MIYLTEKAAKQVKIIAEEQGLDFHILRAKCLGGGCAGFTFDLSFDDKINETDEVSEIDGVKIICDQLSFQYLDEASIDYVTGLMGSGFKFNVPRAKGSCGCGSSFDF